MSTLRNRFPAFRGKIYRPLKSEIKKTFGYVVLDSCYRNSYERNILQILRKIYQNPWSPRNFSKIVNRLTRVCLLVQFPLPCRYQKS